MATFFKMLGIKVVRGIFQLVLYVVRHAEKFSEKYSRLTGFDALLIDRMVYYKFRVNL